MFRYLQFIFFVTISIGSTELFAAEVTREQIKGLDEQVQDIKKDVLDLTSELTRLEEKLLFPSNTQVSFFVSFSGLAESSLDSVQITLDNKIVAHHLYSFRELEALKQGGVQKVYTGNIKSGDHNLVVNVKGKASGDKYSTQANYTVNKSVGPKFVEIIIAGSDSSENISFRDW